MVNLYSQILASTYTIQQIALTAMYLERFRKLVLSNETVLEQIDAKEKGFDEYKVATMLKDTLNNLSSSSGSWTPRIAASCARPLTA